MSRFQVWLGLLCLLGLFAAACAELGVTATGQEKTQDDKGKVSGIVIDKRDNWIKIKGDGDKDATTYVVDGADKKLQKAVAGIFSVARVRLVYKTKDDKRQLVGIERIGAKTPGKVTGVVLGTHQWWVEVKPKNGPAEGYAATYPKEHWDKTLEQIKGLKTGDTVVIDYYIDGERNRIKSMQKIGK